jgi:hypothetical protein
MTGATVWVVEKDIYSDRRIAGVYATREAAIAAHPIPDELESHHIFRPGGWQAESESTWWNGLDYGDCAHCFSWVVES